MIPNYDNYLKEEDALEEKYFDECYAEELRYLEKYEVTSDPKKLITNDIQDLPF